MLFNLLVVLCMFSFCFATETEINFSGLPISFPFADECIPTIEMIDASGKIPSGILSKNIVDIGAFDQCIKYKSKDNSKKGKYCVMRISVAEKNKTDANFLSDFILHTHPYANTFNLHPEERIAVAEITPNSSAALVIGWCIPEKCDPQTITNISNLINIDVRPALGGMLCQTEDDINKELTSSDWGVVCFLIIILIIMILSTVYDIYLHFAQKRPAHLLLIAFSVKTNSEKLLSISKNPDQLPCIHGIRFISMMWVVQGHRYFVSIVQPLINLGDIEHWALDDARHMFIINATVSVDTFFVLSGLLVGYGFCLAKSKGIRFNIPMYYLHRYLRLTPVLAVVVLIHATIIPYFGSGPFWPLAVFTLKEFCIKHWWAPLVYVQNYYNTQEMCVGQTWYLSVDFQLFILSPIILIPLWRWPKLTLITSTILIFGSIISSFVVSYYFKLPAFSFDPAKSEDYMNYYYVATHTRFGPWLMGLMLGYYIFKLKKERATRFQYTLHPAQVVFGWIISLTLMLACLFSSHGLLLKDHYIENSFWNGLHRHGWSLGVCWVIFACTQGYGGVINSFLSWPAFQVLGRFTYTIYLVHLSSQFLLVASNRTSQYFSDFNAMHMFWGDLFLSLGLAICLTLAFESPMLTIEKVIFSFGINKRDGPELPIHQESKHNYNSQPILTIPKESLNEPSTSEGTDGEINKAFEAD